MKNTMIVLSSILFILAVIGCSGHSGYHKSALPDPMSFDAHFGDIDTSGDDLVDWDELKAFFPKANPHIFKALDLNKDKAVDHDEWHEFKEAHGMRDHE